MMKAGSPTADRVIASQMCTGCGLCASLAGTKMAMSPEGFPRPEDAATVSTETEARIAASCPGNRVTPWTDAPNNTDYWGPYRDVLTGNSTDEALRFRGSSGGGVTQFAVTALRSGLVDRVIHITADPDHPLQNKTTVSKTPEEIIGGAGSRYVGSSPLEDIDKELDRGGRFAVIGKPCDISALRGLAQRDPRVDAHIPLMLSFFCAGVPSLKAVDRVIDALGGKSEDVEAFRYRGNGWPGRATALFRDGATNDMSYNDSWGGYLAKDVQFRCKICPDAVGGAADIACADAWYGDDAGYPSFEEQPGRSLMMIRTKAGAELLAKAREAGDIATEPLDIGDIDAMQPAQARRKRLILARTLALRVVGRPVPEMDGLRVRTSAKRSGLSESAKNFAGTLKRVLSK